MSQNLSHLSPAERMVLLPLLRLHDFVYRKTNGRIGHHMPGMPRSLLLHTTGAKTGKARANVLTYARDGQDFVVVASMGGAPRAPGCYHNLKSEPQAAINIGTRHIRVTANPTLPGDPRYARLWRIVKREQLKPLSGLPTAHHEAHPCRSVDSRVTDPVRV
jgi:F420H(2)-dependent quinone reductase